MGCQHSSQARGRLSPSTLIEKDEQAGRSDAGRKVIACYRHYLSTRPEKYPR